MSFTLSLDAESENDDEDVLDLVASLLLRVRKLVKMVKNGSNILRWARKKQKQYNIKYELLKDFRGRWNYTFLCLKRVLEYYSIVKELTSLRDRKDIPGLSKPQLLELHKLQLDDHDWALALALSETLEPFYLATKCLSIRTTQTFGDGFIYLKFIKNFLASPYDLNNLPASTDESIDNSPNSTAQMELKRIRESSPLFYTLVNHLKENLLEAFEEYTSRHLSKKQQDAMLVSVTSY